MKLAGSVLAAMLMVLPCLAQNAVSKQALTAQDVVDRIKSQAGIAWLAETRDTFKAGDPQTPVTGIAVTMMATYSVLQRAVANGQNLIITHEPTFFDDPDKAEPVAQGEQDPVLQEKRAFIEKHHLVIWRFHDHWHRMHPDGIELGNVHALGWEKFQDPNNQYLFTLPETTVGKLADEVKGKFGIASLRVVGDRSMKVTRVALSPGFAGSKREIGALEMPDIQVLLAGETREWETVEYVADAVSQGKQKALIVLSHVPSEQQGMNECARWLKTFVPEVPVQFLPTPDPFAGPQH
ncbi:MAG TPA: Nif3-like dinuclear metal center hexameric protein [Candidatus Eisenbacteria bacterium]|jgi:putative NIF3 family GTP cyclohydrolase 1 type 2|nr:Nif3-like dinuclear metal center hexameric protein [Candidatus Eisenbacteria bacterium]